MAKKAAKQKEKVNKSQAIRDALTRDPQASPKALSAELSAKGIKASPAYVSTIKTSMKGKGKGPRAVGARQSGGMLAASDLMETKKLVDRVGGIENAEALLGTLKKLM